MGRKLNISQPMVLDVMLAPFTESFEIVPSDTTQQWYYTNNSSYLPDRSTNPLILTPTLQVFDPDDEQTYTPSFGDVKWYYLDYGDFVRITNTTEGSSNPYVVYTDGHIKVNKNVPHEAPVTLLCECPYIDPRDSSMSYVVRATVELTTNIDATQFSPVISINAESVIKFDVFKDTPTYTLTAKVMRGMEDITSSSSVEWYALNSDGTESELNTMVNVNGVMIPKYPCYVSGWNQATLTINAMYANKITIIARVFNDTSDTSDPYYMLLFPCKAICTLIWDDIAMDLIVQSNNSGAVRSDTKSMEFNTIVNIKEKTLSDSEKENNILFNWKRRPKGIPTGQSSAPVTDEGWGQKKTITGDTLRANETTLVYNEAYLLGAYENVMEEVSTGVYEAVVDSASNVTDPSSPPTEAVYDRD